MLILTTYDLDEYVYQALRASAAGFMLKATPADRLVDAIEVVAAGEALLAPTLTQRLIAEHVRRPPPTTGAPEQLRELTQREREVLALVACGLTHDEIAGTLVVSLATIKTHVNRIFTKLSLRCRAQAVMTAYETGLIRPRRANHRRAVTCPDLRPRARCRQRARRELPTCAEAALRATSALGGQVERASVGISTQRGR